MSDRFKVTATWDVSAQEGRLANPNSSLSCMHNGAESLGGRGGKANPEELLAAAVASCFVQTWAIFLAKLRVPIETPEVEAETTIEKDPAGGFHVTRVDVRPRVPDALWSERRADVEKTLSLAEKYCIISKVARASAELVVTPTTA